MLPLPPACFGGAVAVEVALHLVHGHGVAHAAASCDDLAVLGDVVMAVGEGSGVAYATSMDGEALAGCCAPEPDLAGLEGRVHDATVVAQRVTHPDTHGVSVPVTSLVAFTLVQRRA